MSDLSGIERKIEQLFGAYKNDLSGKEGCVDLVVEYVKDADSVENNHPFFIHKLCEVAASVVKSSDRLDDYLERLYDFSMTGVRKVKKGTMLESYYRYRKEGILLAKAGYFSSEIFKKTNDIGWGVKAYDAEFESAQISEESNPNHSAYLYDFAGNKAEQISDMVQTDRERLDWLLKAYDNRMRAAEKFEAFKPRRSGFLYGIAGTIARKKIYRLLTDNNQRKTCNKMCCKSGLKASGLLKDFDPLYSARALSFAAEGIKDNIRFSEGQNRDICVRLARSLYNRILNEYDENHSPEMKKLFRYAKGELEYMKRYN